MDLGSCVASVCPAQLKRSYYGDFHCRLKALRKRASPKLVIVRSMWEASPRLTCFFVFPYKTELTGGC